MTRKFKIPANIYTAILMQESGYKSNITSKTCGYMLKMKNNEAISIDESGKVCIAADFGMSQIHIDTIKRYKFNIKKLVTDIEYSLIAGAKVLAWFHKTYAHKELFWWTRYNCGTKSSIERATCNNYKQLVIRYL